MKNVNVYCETIDQIQELFECIENKEIPVLNSVKTTYDELIDGNEEELAEYINSGYSVVIGFSGKTTRSRKLTECQLYTVCEYEEIEDEDEVLCMDVDEIGIAYYLDDVIEKYAA